MPVCAEYASHVGSTCGRAESSSLRLRLVAPLGDTSPDPHMDACCVLVSCINGFQLMMSYL